MDYSVLLNGNIFNFIVMPLFIFIARILDVTFGTIRVIFVGQGLKKLAAFVGFFEVLIWILVARQVISSLDNFLWIIAYALGYAFGTYFGIYLSDKLSIGKLTIRVIAKDDVSNLIENLKNEGFALTYVEGKGINKNTSTILFSTMQVNQLDDFLKILKLNNPKAFYSVESVKMASENGFNIKPKPFKINSLFSSETTRKGK